jgi:hypothetical protein
MSDKLLYKYIEREERSANVFFAFIDISNNKMVDSPEDEKDNYTISYTPWHQNYKGYVAVATIIMESFDSSNRTDLLVFPIYLHRIGCDLWRR